jgi:catechol 2,3-dioxygenase-like lactoylglutathione lyase family enzyme
LNIQQIDIVSLPVTNQEAALAFYTEKLGFEVRLQMPYMDPTSLWIEVAPPNGATRLVLATWLPHLKTGEFTGIVLITTNIEADYVELKSKGVTMTPLDKQAWGTSAMISDPDGNQLVLQQNAPFPS